MTSTDVRATPASTAQRPDWLTADEWPYPVLQHRLGDQVVSYTDVGSGPVLLLVHTGMWSFVWRDVIGRLATDFRVIALDAPGTGFSDRPETIGFEAAADAVDGLVRHLELDDVVIVFHDLGGPVTFEAGARWPQRIRGLVAVNAFGWRPRGFAFRAMLRVMGSGPMRELDALTKFLPAATSTRVGVGRHWSRPTRRTFRRGLRAQQVRGFHRYMRSARRHDYTTIEETTARLARLPMLTIFGERNDPLGFQPQWADRFGRITQLTIPKGNHFPMCDDPELVASSIGDWFRSEVTAEGTDDG